MNILLTAINAKYIHSNLAVYSLRACAGGVQGCCGACRIHDKQSKKDYILEELYKRKPDVLCFSCYIWNIDYVTDIAREYKSFVRQCRYGLEALRCLTRWRHFCGKIHT